MYECNQGRCKIGCWNTCKLINCVWSASVSAGRNDSSWIIKVNAGVHAQLHLFWQKHRSLRLYNTVKGHCSNKVGFCAFTHACKHAQVESTAVLKFRDAPLPWVNPVCSWLAGSGLLFCWRNVTWLHIRQPLHRSPPIKISTVLWN